jgi:excisionase family DNA binding protein
MARPKARTISPKTEDELINWQAAAAVLEVSPFTVRAWVRERAVPFLRRGPRVLFSRRALEAWQRQRTVVMAPLQMRNRNGRRRGA